MVEYLKIETPFNRDNDGTKKMIDGDFRNVFKRLSVDWNRKD